MSTQTAHSFIDSVIAFFNHPFFIDVGGMATVIMFGVFFYTIWVVVSGVFPVWYRLGIGLAKRNLGNQVETFGEVVF